MSVRVRYAPSPTGLQHIGSIRTALFNYYFAKANHGTFILRIEDTDQGRFHEEALQDLYDTFAWLGIEWDEGPDKGGDYGPYVQSERTELYQTCAQNLLDSGNAYRCYCTPERLDEMRKAQKDSFGYDRHCRNLSQAERDSLEASGAKSVIRLKIPLEGTTTFSDFLLGDVEWKNSDVNPDPVLLKSDGFPTYHLANVIDDHLMEITHIMRAQEWLSSGPLHVILYRAFGWEPPKYCHLPMVLGQDGQKLSKRHGSTAVREFRLKGYLPEALMNQVSLIGWAYDDQKEFFTKQEFCELFTLESLKKAPGVFDYKKLDWFNGQYLRRKDDRELALLLKPFMEKELEISFEGEALEKLVRMVPLVKERITVLSDAPAMVRFFFEAPSPEPASLIPKKLDAAAAASCLVSLDAHLCEVFGKNPADQEALLRQQAEALGVNLGGYLMPLRAAVTGTTVSPPLLESLEILGLEEVKTRIATAQTILEKSRHS